MEQIKQQHLEYMFNSLDVVLWTFDLQKNKITYCTHNISTVLGLDESDIFSEDNYWIKYLHPDDLKYITEFKCCTMNEISHKELRLIINQNIKWVKIHVIPYEDPASKQYSILNGLLIDITDQKIAEMSLQASEGKIRTLFNSLSTGIIVFNTNKEVIDANNSACAILGLDLVDMLGLTPFDNRWSAIQSDGSTFTGKNHPVTIALQSKESVKGVMMGVYNRKFREHRWILVDAIVQLDESMNVKEVLVSIVDITNRKKDEDRLKLANIVFDHTLESIVVTDKDGVIQSVNPTFTKVTGFNENEVIGKTPRLLKSKRHRKLFYENLWKSLLTVGYWSGEIWNRRRNGEIYLEKKTIVAVKNNKGDTTQYVSVSKDITYQHEQENQIKQLAYYDPLTELPNKYLFNDRGRLAIAHAHQHQGCVSVLFLDLDRFKNINDSLGHTLGDELLVQTARRLEGCIREGDTLARLSGDEFKILIPSEKNDEGVLSIIHKILEAFKSPFMLEDNEIFITPSIGISSYPEDGDNIEALIKNADTALHRAKAAGGNSYQFYSANMNETALWKLKLENFLRKAIENEELLLYYQPQYSLKYRKLIGMEALIRWNHPKLGIVSPAEFIPLAEETGLIIPIGEWVIKEACNQAKAWQDKGYVPLRMAVNLSSRQFAQKEIVQTVSNILKNSGLDARYLEIEITESMAMDVDYAIEVLHALKDLGVLIAMDDFGTGYSSLSYLRDFPIDTLKIDQSFIREISIDSCENSIVPLIVSMASHFGLKTIAEGVENEEHVEFLKAINCDEGQGYYFSKPLPADEFEKLLGEGLGV